MHVRCSLVCCSPDLRCCHVHAPDLISPSTITGYRQLVLIRLFGLCGSRTKTDPENSVLSSRLFEVLCQRTTGRLWSRGAAVDL